ncbi:hypothetical protein G4Y79_00325 [Phototrophicus methaneseepsis]|uniref:Uncharacterized protein n=1 Tax=Phototrophicus methaneseepsis TaxID=2710758 RepID=A0A7S8E9H5_9CHLR|nr:hypothetical protein [Phototrophicus methaneseepsis]QPC82855.1 hypothetical protein G4Y79_00325 [Phototrophicus methaneseepsis]
MKRSLFVVLFILLVIIAVAVIWAMLAAPDTTNVAIRGCLTGADDACLALPQIEGDNLDGDAIRLPDDIATEYALIVMPFSREQQEEAQAWLPTFQEIAQDDPRLSYYSFAVLVVEQAFRPLVVGGLNLGVRDPEIRPSVIVAFVEEDSQARVLAALNTPTRDEMLVLLVDQSGQVLWRETGPYDEALAASLRAALPAND